MADSVDAYLSGRGIELTLRALIVLRLALLPRLVRLSLWLGRAGRSCLRRRGFGAPDGLVLGVSPGLSLGLNTGLGTGLGGSLGVARPCGSLLLLDAHLLLLFGGLRAPIGFTLPLG